MKFSEKRGWHEQSFKLALSTKTESATIRYTLDGTRPTPENGHTYEFPVDIAKTTTPRCGLQKGTQSLRAIHPDISFSERHLEAIALTDCRPSISHSRGATIR